MGISVRGLVILAVLALVPSLAPAHFNMLLPQTAFGKRGEAVAVTYQWGHPFEHQLFDAPSPQSIFAIDPEGKKIELLKALEKTAVPGENGKKVTAYRLMMTPEQRGDYLLVLTTPAIWMDEDKEFVQDTVKVILHVRAQKGWDRLSGQPFEMLPLTRPYGLLPGMVFQAQVLTDGKPLGNSMVEIERYNPTPPKALPPDELVTRRCKTDPNGVVTATLTDPGWWCLTAERDAGKREREGKSYPVRQRTTLWVFVHDRNTVPAGK